MVETARDKYRYACDLDAGDVACQYTTEAADISEVRSEAMKHRASHDNREEDVDPAAIDALIEMQRVEA